MGRSVQQSLPPMEVNRVQARAAESESAASEVNEVHCLPEKALRMAKAAIGDAVREAIKGRGLKEYGSKSLLSEVCSGEKVPDYLARIYQDKTARRRLALALLEEDTDVIVTTTITVPHKKAG